MKDKEQLKVLLRNALEATALYFYDLYESRGDIHDFATDEAKTIHEAMQQVYLSVDGTSAEIVEINKNARHMAAMFIAINKVYGNERG